MINNIPKISSIQPAIMATINDDEIVKIEINIDTNDIILNQIYALKVMNSYNNNIIGIFENSLEQNEDNDQSKLIFVVNKVGDIDIGFVLNNFYKLQIAYKNGEEIEPYSNIGIAKCIQKPSYTVSLDNNLKAEIKLSGQTEKIKTVIFDYKIGDKTVYSSGIIYNNATNNVISYSSPYIYSSTNSSTIKVTASYTTVNNYKGIINSKEQTLNNLTKDLDIAIEYNENMDNYQYKNLPDLGKIRCIDDYSIQYKKVNLKEIDNNTISAWVILDIKEDNNIKSYETYSYIIVGNEISSNPDTIVINEETSDSDTVTDDEKTPKSYKIENVIVDFEDSFIFDNDKQYILKFNPKVSSFKEVRQEQKVETIGSQYPFIYRNEIIRYKEFQIGGLMSRLSDPKNEDDLYQERTHAEQAEIYQNNFDTNLTGANIQLEREYKMEMLSWLNNGQPKVFKSPTEGNFIVRLMNISLTPEDRLGRMLHSFTATAVEIAEYNTENLIKYNLL